MFNQPGTCSRSLRSDRRHDYHGRLRILSSRRHESCCRAQPRIPSYARRPQLLLCRRLDELERVIRFITVGAVTAALTITLVGCAASSQPAHPSFTPAPSGSSKIQQAALADGFVSSDEYHAGFRRYEACVKKAGYEVLEQGEVGNVIQYGTPTVGQKPIDACYVKEFQDLDALWQSENALSSPTFDRFRDCLTKAGITPSGTVDGIVAQLSAAHIDETQCISGG